MAARNKVMVLNAGSSSLKFKLFEMGGGAATGFKAVASGICERIGDPSASFLRVRGTCVGQVGCGLPLPCRLRLLCWLLPSAHRRFRRRRHRRRRRLQLQASGNGGAEAKVQEAMPNHTSALQLVSKYLSDTFSGVSAREGGLGWSARVAACTGPLHWPAVCCWQRLRLAAAATLGCGACLCICGVSRFNSASSLPLPCHALPCRAMPCPALPMPASACACPCQHLPALPAALQDFTKEVHGVGHRVVHGREISEPVLIR